MTLCWFVEESEELLPAQRDLKTHREEKRSIEVAEGGSGDEPGEGRGQKRIL